MKEKSFEKVSPVALPSFQSRVHSVHTTLKTPRKKMLANPPECILYNKKYNMRRPIFASIILLLPAHAQNNAGEIVQESNTEFIPKNKPHAQKLLTQFLRHLPAHHPEVEANRIAISIMKKAEILKNTSEREKGGMAWHCLQRAVWHNGGCTSSDGATKQQVKGLVASAGSPPLRQATTTLCAILGQWVTKE